MFDNPLFWPWSNHTSWRSDFLIVGLRISDIPCLERLALKWGTTCCDVAWLPQGYLNSCFYHFELFNSLEGALWTEHCTNSASEHKHHAPFHSHLLPTLSHRNSSWYGKSVCSQFVPLQTASGGLHSWLTVSLGKTNVLHLEGKHTKEKTRLELFPLPWGFLQVGIFLIMWRNTWSRISTPTCRIKVCNMGTGLIVQWLCASTWPCCQAPNMAVRSASTAGHCQKDANSIFGITCFKINTSILWGNLHCVP